MRRLLPVLLLVASCTGNGESDEPIAPDPYDVQVGPYAVTIRTTSYGIPHIVAEDEGSIGYGIGQVWGRNHICTLADQILKVRSERARYFGEGQLDSDFGWLALGVRRQAEEGFLSLDQRLQDRIVGVAAGYNQHLADTGVDNLPAACRGAEWVKPIDHIDLLSYYLSLGQWGSGYNLVELIGQARPPGGESSRELPLEPPPMEVLEPVKHPPIGSNGWAIGRDLSSTDGGLLLSNTHFPMTGERQWMEMHTTIPGELDVYGVALVGLPLVAMGFNEDIAWTHTVSNTPRFIPYLLDLAPGGIRYEYDGEIVPMTATEYTVEVQNGGSVESVSRTLYSSQYGPMWNAPVVGWGGQAMTYRDVNDNNLGMLPTFDGMGRATDLESFKASHRDFQGIPWVHTMVTDKEGNAFYTDSAATPNISPEAWAAYDAFASSDFIIRQFQGFGLSVFDGGDPTMAWTEDERAARPGAVPFDDAPQVTRGDYVTNANQNYWLANGFEPLDPAPRIYGPTRTPATPRTRMNHRYLQGLGEDPERGEDGVWSLEEVEAAALSMRSSISELLLADVVTRCDAAVGPVSVTYEGNAEAVDIGPACRVLGSWDGRGGTESVGAHVWRELLGSGPIEPDDLGDAGPLFATGFDPNDPIGTPFGLAPAPESEPDPVLAGLALATLRLNAAGIPLDAPLGEVQIRKMADREIATPGGNYFEGYIGIATWSGRGGDSTLLPGISRGTEYNEITDLTDEGYVITNGNSWVMALQYTPEGPVARAVMTYSQSEDPDSPYFADQTELYASQRMRPILFREADILADANLVVEELTYP